MGLFEQIKKSIKALSEWGNKKKKKPLPVSKRAPKAKPPAAKALKKKAVSQKKRVAKRPLKKKTAKQSVADDVKEKPAPIKKAKKKVSKKAVKKPKKRAVKKPAATVRRQVSKTDIPEIKLPGIKIGTITHYFPKAGAAAFLLDQGDLNVGDKIHIKGSETDFKQKVLSLQINREAVTAIQKGTEGGLEIKKEVRPGDIIYKV